MAQKPKILFVYDIAQEEFWRDGLWAALKELEKDWDIEWFNLANHKESPLWAHDFLLGWGGFNSPVDQFVSNSVHLLPTIKSGLCLAGYGFPPPTTPEYDVVFYEEDWARRWTLQNCAIQPEKLIHAFGVNTDIFNSQTGSPVIWDYTTVGAFSNWKRQTKLLDKPGYKLAVGQIQKNNLDESMSIVGDLLLGGVCVSDMVVPEKLADIYKATKTVYIPAETVGGGERAVLEARACGTLVEVEYDNPKLQELLTGPVWDHHYYAAQLKSGIEKVLKA